MKVLITDADHRNALAAVRTLGKNGIHVFVAGPNKLGLHFSQNTVKKGNYIQIQRKKKTLLKT